MPTNVYPSQLAIHESNLDDVPNDVMTAKPPHSNSRSLTCINSRKEGRFSEKMKVVALNKHREMSLEHM